jgi:uncharacterized membrane protein YqjE
MIKHDPPVANAGEPLVARKSQSRPPASDPVGGDNVVDLLKQLAGQGSHLAEQQLALIKAEIRESTAELKVAVAAMAGAAVVGLAGLGVTLMGLAYLLGDAIDNMPLATLIVGLVALGIAYLMYRSGATKMSGAQLSPDRTQRTLQRTPDAVRGDLSTEHTR